MLWWYLELTLNSVHILQITPSTEICLMDSNSDGGHTASACFKLCFDEESDQETLRVFVRRKAGHVCVILYSVLSPSSCTRQCPSIALTQLLVPPNTIFLLFHLISSTERIIPLHPEKPLIIYFCFGPCGTFLRKVSVPLWRIDAALPRLLVCLYTDLYLMHALDCGACVRVRWCVRLIAFVCTCACAASVLARL